MQVFVIIILTFISSWIFGKIKFSTPVLALKLSYSKTLGGKVSNEELIKESLFQLKTIVILSVYLLTVLLPFIITMIILFALNLNIEDYLWSVQNQLVILISFVVFAVIKKYVSK